MAVRDAVRSCVRGIGAEKQCLALDLQKLVGVPDPTPAAEGPTLPLDTVLLFSLFACREMEAAVRLVKRLVSKKTKDVG